MSSSVEALQAGIYEGICSGCPMNGKELLGSFVCAKTAGSIVLTMAKVPFLGSHGIDFMRVAEDFTSEAQNCARTTLRHAFDTPQDERAVLSPTRTYSKADIFNVIARHTDTTSASS